MGDAWKIEVLGFTRNGRIPSDKPKEGNQFVIVELRMTYIGEHENAETTGSATDFHYSFFTEEGRSIPTGFRRPNTTFTRMTTYQPGPISQETSRSKLPSDEANGLTLYVRTNFLFPDDPGGFLTLG